VEAEDHSKLPLTKGSTMDTALLRSKRLWIPTAAVVLLLGVGGVVWATTASADLDGSERDRVSRAATAAVGGGEVLEAETSDDVGEAYEVEVRRTDGSKVDVTLDKDLSVVSQEPDDADERNGRDDDGDDADERNGRDDDGQDAGEVDDRALTSAERTRAAAAAKAAVGGGTVTEVEASDDQGEAYEVEVRKAGGTEWDVTLDSSFDVVRKTADR
jgi:uncharacterized membrane protein YkoI